MEPRGESSTGTLAVCSLLLSLVSSLLPRAHRARYHAEWMAEAHTLESAAARWLFVASVCRGAPRAALVLHGRTQVALFELSLAVHCALVGPLYLWALSVGRGYFGLSVGFALMAAALLLGNTSVRTGGEDVFGMRRTHLAGLLLAAANLYLAALPSRLPSAVRLPSDDAVLVAVAIGVLLVVAAHYAPITDPSASRAGLVLLGTSALFVGLSDARAFSQLDDPALRLGLALTGCGAVAASVLIGSALRAGTLFRQRVRPAGDVMDGDR